MNVIQKSNAMGAQSMTSLEIAHVTGKMHKDVMKAIRNMEPAWLKVNGRNFALVDYLITRMPRVNFALVTLSQRPSAFTLPRNSMTRLAPSW